MRGKGRIVKGIEKLAIIQLNIHYKLNENKKLTQNKEEKETLRENESYPNKFIEIPLEEKNNVQFTDNFVRCKTISFQIGEK